MKFKIGQAVSKVTGYAFDGHIVAQFWTVQGKPRYVVDHEQSRGMLHIFSPDQLHPDLSREDLPLPATTPVSQLLNLLKECQIGHYSGSIIITHKAIDPIMITPEGKVVDMSAEPVNEDAVRHDYQPPRHSHYHKPTDPTGIPTDIVAKMLGQEKADKFQEALERQKEEDYYNAQTAKTSESKTIEHRAHGVDNRMSGLYWPMTPKETTRVFTNLKTVLQELYPDLHHPAITEMTRMMLEAFNAGPNLIHPSTEARIAQIATLMEGNNWTWWRPLKA